MKKREKRRDHTLSKLIYVADDEENIRMLIKSFLENEGYEVRVFSDGAGIRRAFQERVPDLIILDVKYLTTGL